MGYLWLEEHGLIRHPAVEGTNSAEDAMDFAAWVRNGLIRSKDGSCTGTTLEYRGNENGR